VGGYVYILASAPYGTLYVGVTNDLAFRQHREGHGSAFARKYRVHRLVHYEVFEDIWNAIHREKRLKKGNRWWKIDLKLSLGSPGSAFG
jgi:putative endonuclease